MERHRATRPRFPRISVALTSVAVTAIAVLGGTGVLPTDQPATAAGSVSQVTEDRGTAVPNETPTPLSSPGTRSEQRAADSTVLPALSGQGRRVVFSIDAQRVWLVSDQGEAVRTYPVSGSVTDNLEPGDYQVYSRSRHAIGVEDSGTMEYMVRFAHGENAAIGFHDIPVKDGTPVQTKKQLGAPQSHGCIRQARPDARALWAFAPVGTEVVVLT